MADPSSAQTLQKLDTLSLEDLRYTTAMEESSVTAGVTLSGGSYFRPSKISEDISAHILMLVGRFRA
jgi:hypothetical protein